MYTLQNMMRKLSVVNKQNDTFNIELTIENNMRNCMLYLLIIQNLQD